MGNGVVYLNRLQGGGCGNSGVRALRSTSRTNVLAPHRAARTHAHVHQEDTRVRQVEDARFTLATGARQLVVHEALDTTVMSGVYLSWLTPITNMGASPEGAEMITFLAPPESRQGVGGEGSHEQPCTPYGAIIIVGRTPPTSQQGAAAISASRSQTPQNSAAMQLFHLLAVGPSKRPNC